MKKLNALLKNRTAVNASLLWTGSGLVCIFILFLLSASFDIRPLQDDFMYRPVINLQEFKDVAQHLYLWSGRLTTMTIFLVLGMNQLYALVPLISIGLLFATLFVVLKVFLVSKLKNAEYAYPLITLLAGVGVVGFFLAVPSPYTAFYWLSSAPIHLWSYCLAALVIVWALRPLPTKNRTRIIRVLMIGVSALVVGAMSEIAALVLLGFFGLFFAYATIRKLSLQTAASGFVGSVLALLVLFLSPGAQARRAAEQTEFTYDLVRRLPRVVVDNFQELFTSVLNNKSVLIIIILIGIAVGFGFVREVRLRNAAGWWAVMTAFLLGLGAINYAAVYTSVQFAIVWTRTQSISTLAVITILFFAGVVAGLAVRRYAKSQPWRYTIVVGVVVLLCGITVWKGGDYLAYTVDFRQQLTERAKKFDERAKLIDEIKMSKVCRILPSTTLNKVQEGFDLVNGEPLILNLEFSQYHRLPCIVWGDLTLQEAAQVTNTLRTK